MKTAISLPNTLFESAEHLAQKLHVSRSFLYCLALKEFLKRHQRDHVTKTLNEIYSQENSKIDPLVQTANQKLLSSATW